MSKSLFSGALWSVAEGWINQALQFVVFLLLARFLSPGEFGLAATALLLCQLIQNVLLGGIHTPLVRGLGEDLARDSTGFWLGAGLGGAMLAALLLGADTIEAAYGMAGLAPLLRLLGVGGFFAGLCVVYQARLMRVFDFRLLAIRSLLGTAAGGLLGVSLAAAGAGVFSLAAQFVASTAVGLLVLVVGASWRPGLCWSTPAAKNIVSFGSHVSATSLVNFFNENADVLIVGYVLGPAEAGVYMVGKRVISAANALLAGALSRVALPAFAQLQDAPDRGVRRFLAAVASTAMITTPAFVGLALVAPEFVHLAFGPQWDAAVPVMQILCFFGLLQSLGVYNHAAVLALGKPQWQTGLTLLYALANLVVLGIAVRFGIVAVAIAYVMRAYLLYPLSLLLVMRLLPLSALAYVRALIPPVAGAALMAGSLIAARAMVADVSDVARIAILVGAGGVAYSAALLVFARPRLTALWSAVGPHLGRSSPQQN